MSEIVTQPSTTIQQRIRLRLGRHGVFWITGGVIALVVVLFVWFLFQPSNAPVSPGVLPVGQTAPAFTLKDTTGRPISLAQYHGHPVIINFWGTFCQPCQSETPQLERAYLANQSKGLIVLGVDQDEPVDSVAKFGQDYGVTYPLLPDIGQKINKKYGVTGLPVSYFIDSNGVIRYAVNGVLQPATLTTGLHTIGING